ncbi:MAG: hypothetical protein SX243_22760 [Acidobacteriota bacterium]|nr:hypothetical protein [Acidobacteriota bacterium]
MWSENAGWISLSCLNTASCGDQQWGVEHDGLGNLTGFAWGENFGWISFSCTNTNSCSSGSFGVHADLATGKLSGFAWSENLGWISFACENTSSCANADYGVDVEVPFLLGPIFIDGFETGDASRWQARVPTKPSAKDAILRSRWVTTILRSQFGSTPAKSPARQKQTCDL